MMLSAYADLVVVTIVWLLFLAANFLFTCVRNILWILNGTYWCLLRRGREENYDRCVHVMDVVYKHRLDIFLEARKSDYVLVHDHFEHPDYLLRDDISLLNITATEAIFVQNKPGSKPAFRHNFIIIGQHFSADKILTIPLNHFHQFAETMKRDGGNILFLQNQSRCGGSLFTSILMETGRCVTFNEPHAFNSVCRGIYCNKTWSKEEGARVFRNVVHVLCKPFRGLEKPPLLYVIKPTATSIISCDFVHKTMPETVQLFIYRHPLEVTVSVRRLGEAIKSLKLMFYAPNIPNLIAPAFALTGNVDTDFLGWTPRHGADLEFGFRVAALTAYHYLRCRDIGVPISALKYEDLVKHPREIVRYMFKVCRMPDDLVALGLQAMKKDSQEDTMFSRKKLKKLIPNPPKPTPEFMEVARDMAAEFGVPSPQEWTEDFRLPGSFIP